MENKNNVVKNNDLSPTSIDIFNTQSMGSIMLFAETMSQARIAVPAHLQGNTADCLAITMQAIQWGMDPFSVARKTHIVNGVLGYEAQLVNAVISSSTSIRGRFKYEYSEGWEDLAGQVKHVKNSNNKTVPEKSWTNEKELSLWVRVGAVLSGEDKITWGQRVYLASVLTRSSPLWVTAPQQQISYLALKYWARLFTPDVVLGVYDKEALEQPNERTERDITPQKDLNDIFSGVDDSTPEKAKESPPAKGKTAEIVDSAPSEFEIIKNYIGEIVDEQSFNVASEAFNNATNKQLCSASELQLLFDLFTAKNNG